MIFHSFDFLKSSLCTPTEIEILTGLMLGDGSLNNPNQHKRSTGNFRFEATFKASCHDFILWYKFDLLPNLCTKSEPTPYPKKNPVHYWFCSKSLPLFTELSKIWYIFENGKKKKVLPHKEYLKTFLTPIALAHWIMGDGYWNKNNKTILICTECFSTEEVFLLIQVLNQNFGLKATIRKRIVKSETKGYRIAFSRKVENIQKLQDLVKPYFHTSMMYKLNLTNSTFCLINATIDFSRALLKFRYMLGHPKAQKLSKNSLKIFFEIVSWTISRKSPHSFRGLSSSETTCENSNFIQKFV